MISKLKSIRAVYLADLTYNCGLLPFYPEENTETGKVVFSHKTSDDDEFPLEYPFNVPFIDDGWLIQKHVATIDGVDFYEGDIVASASGKYFMIVYDNDRYGFSLYDCYNKCCRSFTPIDNAFVLSGKVKTGKIGIFDGLTLSM
jgi:hypothetical protein